MPASFLHSVAMLLRFSERCPRVALLFRRRGVAGHVLERTVATAHEICAGKEAIH